MTAEVGSVAVHVASRGNGFMTDIASWIAEAVTATGRSAQLVMDSLPSADGDLHLVVAPHEFFTLSDASATAIDQALAVSVLIGTEQPGTPWFEISADLASRALAVADINTTAVEALATRGITAAHLRLGAVPSMIAPGSDSQRSQRSLDVMFLGGLDPRRARALASLAPHLAPLQSEIRCVISDRPLLSGDPGVILGAEKYARLADTRAMINLHRDRPDDAAVPYLEWVRLIEAMANRVVVITEPVTDYGPLIPGIHVLTASIEEMGDLLASLGHRVEELDQIAERAFTLVTQELDLAAALDHLCTGWQQTKPHVRAKSAPRRLQLRTPAPRPGPALARRRVNLGLGVFQPFEDLRTKAKALALHEQRLLRALDRTEALLRYGDHDHVEIHRSPAALAATSPEVPEVSVVVTLYNYADVVAETLHSVAASQQVNCEVIVIDDHSRDDSVQVALRALAEHPDLKWTLVARSTNRGLAAARNLGVQMALSDYVMIVDADNHLYPRGLAALRQRLMSTPSASASYSLLEDFGASQGVRSAVAWDVRRLCEANYLDAQSMWRRSALLALGGYRDDDDLVFGWEDWDLWLRLAHTGGEAVLHPEILGRYRVQEVSMIALTNLARAESIQALRDRYPGLPWPVEIAL
jgi:hypothetical protein